MRPLRCPRRGSAPRGHEAMVSAIWGGRGEFALNILLRNTLTLSWSLLLWLKRHEELRLIKCTNLVDILTVPYPLHFACNVLNIALNIALGPGVTSFMLRNRYFFLLFANMQIDRAG